jgi:CheY-like chemotaxis protein
LRPVGRSVYEDEYMQTPLPPILVVDDDDDTRELYVAAFAAAGWDVRAAASIAEACASIAEAKPDVLIADYRLPDGTGSALLERCADARPRFCVLVTGFGEKQVAADGFDRVFTKPVDFKVLVQAIRAAAASTGRD